MNGVLNVNKPSSFTSHDVVAVIRKILNEKQIGHLGTLDPLATGVLPLVIGTATRLVEYASFDKEYAATCLLGRTTDSYDITGKVLTEKTTAGLSQEQVKREVLNLLKITEQVPPMVSAVKQGGHKLYELARKGQVVERQPRPIQVEAVEILKIELPRVTFRVVCSAGTYVRGLCQTLGEVLGVGGCMESLERTRVGPFLLQEAISLDEIKKRMEKGELSGMLLSAGLLVQRLPEIKLEDAPLGDLCQGKVTGVSAGAPGVVRVMNLRGNLCAIGVIGEDGKSLKPKKVFGLEGI